MRRINNEIGNEFADDINFYIVSREDLSVLEDYRQDNNLPWPVASAGRGVWQDLRIYSQGTKIALNSDGVISHRSGHGTGDYNDWRHLFQDLSAN